MSQAPAGYDGAQHSLANKKMGGVGPGNRAGIVSSLTRCVSCLLMASSSNTFESGFAIRKFCHVTVLLMHCLLYNLTQAGPPPKTTHATHLDILPITHAVCAPDWLQCKLLKHAAGCCAPACPRLAAPHHTLLLGQETPVTPQRLKQQGRHKYKHTSSACHRFAGTPASTAMAYRSISCKC